MALAPKTKIGPYEIVSALGAGGMEKSFELGFAPGLRDDLHERSRDASLAGRKRKSRKIQTNTGVHGAGGMLHLQPALSVTIYGGRPRSLGLVPQNGGPRQCRLLSAVLDSVEDGNQEGDGGCSVDHD